MLGRLVWWKWSDAVNMNNRFDFRPSKVRHVFRPHSEVAGPNRLQGRTFKTATHGKPPSSLNNHDVFVHRLHMRHDEIACIVMNANCENLARFFWIAPHSFNPLP